MKPSSSVILNVDDTAANLYAKTRVLRHAGFMVVEAQTGMEALVLATNLQPALILLDVHLPDMNGFEVCRQLKQATHTAHLLVLHISASFVEVSDKTRGLLGGADGYLTEPVEPEELIATIRAFLRLRQTETALRESEERLRIALEAGKMATWDWDLVSQRIVWSAQLAPMLGLAKDAFEGTWEAFFQLVHPDDRAQVNAAIEHSLQEGAAYQIEFRMVHANGQRHWVEARGQVYYDVNGHPVRMAGIHHDITDRRVAAEALQTLNESLEQRVYERTQQLERSNRELDQFAYIASHDLKAPLRAIEHLTNWITEDAHDVLPESSKVHLTKLRARVKRMELLLDDLLAYSRVGRRDGSPEPLDVAALIQNVVALLVPPTGFTVNVTSDLPTLMTPRVPLEIVLRNLIGNAFKHHHQPHAGEVHIHAQVVDGMIEFCIRDNGPGIDPQFHERIFGVFQTLQPRDLIEGSGMGLALVKKTVEYYQGTIHVESAVGKGATFCFTWPQKSIAN